MNQNIPAFPLCWPDRFPRAKARVGSPFKTALPGAIKNVQTSLRLFAQDSGLKMDGVVISSNVTLGMEKPADPGVAVWFTWDGLRVCIAVDRYSKIEANLQAIHLVLEARRTELRHGGLEITRATFTGFLALPNSNRRKWHEVLALPAHESTTSIKARFRELAKKHHPDNGGNETEMADINAAYEEAMKERGISA